MIKEAIYLAALLHRAPIKKPAQLIEVLGSEELLREWLAGLMIESEKIVLSNPNLKRVEKSGYLQPIFEGLQRKGHSPEYWFSAKPLSLSADFFPTKEPVGDFKNLWSKLEQEMSRLPQSDLRLYAETVMHLLHKYTVAIPCGFEGKETVSYYDYARNLAGVAVSLYDWWQASDKKGAFSIDDDGEPLLLVGGDLSGIQEYIYQIVSKSATRSLKGRSFFLFLLADNILEALLEELELFQANVVYNSGGGFLLTAPNTEKAKKTIALFEEETLNRKLFEHFNTILYCALASAPFGIKIDLSYATGAVHDEFKRKKGQKFREEVEAYSRLFEPEKVEQGGLQARDIVSGDEMTVDDLHHCWYLDPEGETDLEKADQGQKIKGENLVKEVTAWQILLGQQLKKVNFWIKSKTTIAELSEKGRVSIDVNPLGLGIYNYFLEEEDWLATAKSLSDYPLTVYRLNEFGSFQTSSVHWLTGYSLYGGNEGPVDNLGTPKTFSEMAGGKEEYKGKWTGYEFKDLEFKRLGVLRMDVDGLGVIFRTSIESSEFSLAHYSTLSRSLDFFFKGYLNTLWRTHTVKDEKVKNDTQIIYAGGDDLFIVGRWDLALSLAKRIQAEFRSWVCENPFLSISGGLSVVTHKFPAMKAVDIAGSAEKDAKSNTRGGNSKRSFTLLSAPLHWEKSDSWMDELDLVETLKKELLRIIESKGVSRGILTKIMHHYLARQMQHRQGKNPKWKWTIAYDLSQTEQRLRSTRQYEGEAFIKEIKKAIQFEKYRGEKVESNYPFIELLALAARWAELEERTTRSLKNREKELIV